MDLLGFGLVQAVDLLGQIGDDGVVLLPEGGESRLVVEGAVVKFLLQFRQFRLTLAVQLDLHRIRIVNNELWLTSTPKVIVKSNHGSTYDKSYISTEHDYFLV